MKPHGGAPRPGDICQRQANEPSSSTYQIRVLDATREQEMVFGYLSLMSSVIITIARGRTLSLPGWGQEVPTAVIRSSYTPGD